MKPMIAQANAIAASDECRACGHTMTAGYCTNHACVECNPTLSAADDMDDNYWMDEMQEKAIIGNVRSRNRYQRASRQGM